MKKNKFTLVIPEGWTREEYLRELGETPPEEEPTSFWDRKIEVDPVTGSIILFFSELFFGLIKCFLLFIEAYPKAREQVRQEELARSKKSNFSSTRR